MIINAIETCSTSANRVALVTGANKGIGFCIALALASSGLFHEVILGCRDSGRGNRAVQEIQQNMVVSVPDVDTQVSFLPLDVGNKTSHTQFRLLLEEKLDDNKKLAVLVNNAGIAFRSSDPTPYKDKAKQALDVNFRGAVDLTEELLPLLRRADDARIVNVATNYPQQIKSQELRQKFTDPTLTIKKLQALVNQFEQDAHSETYVQNGWGSSPYGPYGISKLALVAATKVWAREERGIKVNCFNPGFCKTDLTANNEQGRPPSDGAKTGVWLATTKDCPTGEFFQDMQPSDW
mmetsp:Transcript_28091/g.40209  ORF Transcript_28091/g.40209 Transcript_28091/m.40209 type:complete len:293 (+) Transcript_28091:44-922(+)